MPIWNQLGMQAAGNAMSGAMGLILGNINDRRQLRQQQKLQDQQIRGSKELTDYNYLKQMQMWNETNYPAQMAMLKKAGLNPALIYDNGGMQASTSIDSGKVQGGQAPAGGGEVMGMMQGQNLALMTAQIENIKAQTEKTKADTMAVQPGIERTKAETASISQGIKNQQAQLELTEVETSIKSIQEHIMGKTQNTQVALLMNELDQAVKKLDILENTEKITDAEATQAENKIRLTLANIAIDTWLKGEQGKLANQHVKESMERVSDMINDNMHQAEKGTGAEISDDIDTGFPKEITDILEAIGFAAILKGKPVTPPANKVVRDARGRRQPRGWTDTLK